MRCNLYNLTFLFTHSFTHSFISPIEWVFRSPSPLLYSLCQLPCIFLRKGAGLTSKYCINSQSVCCTLSNYSASNTSCISLCRPAKIHWYCWWRKHDSITKLFTTYVFYVPRQPAEWGAVIRTCGSKCSNRKCSDRRWVLFWKIPHSGRKIATEKKEEWTKK